MRMRLLLGCIGVAASAWADPIRIDNGRQLFVDDFLIASTNGVVRHWNTPVKHPKPVLVPTSPDGTRIASCVMATNGGLWWDPTIGRYRLWYETEWTGHLRYAESRDGLVWEFPDLGVVKGTNRVFADADNVIDQSLDSWSVWPDYQAANPYANWKMMVSSPANGFSPDTLYASTDGRAFTKLGLAGWSCDRSTMHYDAILGKWIFSLRAHGRDGGIERCRSFWAQEKCEPAATPYSSDWCRRWHADAAHAEPWTQLQEIDYGLRGQLYNFDAVPYESVMLGALEVLHNLPGDNNEAELVGLPKQTSLRFAFSRDGRNYLPEPAEVALKPEGWGSGKWDTGYLSAMGGICTVTEDELRFYYSAMRGDGTKRFAPPNDKKPPMYRRGIYWNGAIGYATLRRDGFAGLVADGAGEIVTKGVVFSGKHLFVNVDALFGDVSAEILDAAGRPIAGFTAEDCRVIRYDDTTKRELVFAGGDLSALAGKAVSIRFRLVNATLYSFWVSPSARGESRGYVAAGGPAYPGLKDE